MKTCGGVKFQPYHFGIGRRWVVSLTPLLLYLRWKSSYPLDRRLVPPRADLDFVEWDKSLSLGRNQTPVTQSVACRYIDWARNQCNTEAGFMRLLRNASFSWSPSSGVELVSPFRPETSNNLTFVYLVFPAHVFLSNDIILLENSFWCHAR
jgi:hypothetical protein